MIDPALKEAYERLAVITEQFSIASRELQKMLAWHVVTFSKESIDKLLLKQDVLAEFLPPIPSSALLMLTYLDGFIKGLAKETQKILEEQK